MHVYDSNCNKVVYSKNPVESFSEPDVDDLAESGNLNAPDEGGDNPKTSQVNPFGLRILMRISILLIIAATLCSLMFSSNIGVNTILHLCIGIFLIAVSGILFGQYMSNSGQKSKINKILCCLVIVFTVIFVFYAIYLLFTSSGVSRKESEISTSYRYAALLAIMGLILTAAVSGNILQSDLGESL